MDKVHNASPDVENIMGGLSDIWKVDLHLDAVPSVGLGTLGRAAPWPWLMS